MQTGIKRFLTLQHEKDPCTGLRVPLRIMGIIAMLYLISPYTYSLAISLSTTGTGVGSTSSILFPYLFRSFTKTPLNKNTPITFGKIIRPFKMSAIVHTVFNLITQPTNASTTNKILYHFITFEPIRYSAHLSP